jgi:hypothetical protein
LTAGGTALDTQVVAQTARDGGEAFARAGLFGRLRNIRKNGPRAFASAFDGTENQLVATPSVEHNGGVEQEKQSLQRNRRRIRMFRSEYRNY